VNEDLQAIIQAKQTHSHSGIHSLAPHVAVMRDATMIPVLMDMMFSEVKHVRHSAYFIAKWVATDLPLPIEPMIEALIAEPVVDKRGNLSTALGLRGADAVPHLEKLMQHEDALLRAEAIAALGVNLYTQQPTDSRVVAALTNALQASHEGTVVKAIDWLAIWTDPQIKAAIAALANDQRELVKKAAQKALQ
jgi:HEAT repeat protein